MNAARRIGFRIGLCLLSFPIMAETLLEPLFRLDRLEGRCRVRLPGMTVFEDAVDGKAYPYGSLVDVGQNGSASIRLGAEDRTTLGGATRVIVDYPGRPDDAPRMLLLERGRLSYATTRQLGEADLLRVLTPMAMVHRIMGEGRIELTHEENQLTLLIAPRTESLRVKGPQFTIPRLAAGNQARTTMSRDRHYLALRNLRGTYAVRVETPDEPIEPFDLTPQMVVKFWRRPSPAGERMAVSGLVANPDGAIQRQFAFLEAESRLPDVPTEFLQPRTPPRKPARGWRRLLFWR